MAELKINWKRLTKGSFRDKEIRELVYGIASGPLALRNEGNAEVLVA